MASASLPANVHLSTHPCLRAKLSQLRSKDANARETKSLVHEIALILGCEALANSLEATSSGTVSSTYTDSNIFSTDPALKIPGVLIPVMIRLKHLLATHTQSRPPLPMSLLSRFYALV